MNQAICFYQIAPKQRTFFKFSLQVFRQAGPAQWVDYLAPMGNKNKAFFQGRNDALPVQELNWESATFLYNKLCNSISVH